MHKEKRDISTSSIKSSRTAISVLLGSAAVVLGSVSTLAYADNTIVIGFAGALTGAQAHYGKDSERGIVLALDKINATHPKIGGVATTFVLDAQDDAADPKTATNVAQRFVDKKVDAVIGHQNSGTSIAVARIYSAAGVAELTPSATNPQFTRMGYNTTFRMLANDNFLGQAVSKYAASQLHMKDIAVIDDRTAYGQGIADVFADSAKHEDMKVVAHEYTNDQAFDFGASLTLIKGKKPDGIFFGGMDPQAGPMLRQMKKLGVNVPLLGGDGVCTAEIQKLAGDALNGNLFCADGGRSLEKMPGGPAFVKAFQAKYREPVQLYAPYAYDAMMAIYHAVVLEQSGAPDKIVEGLHKVSFQGVTGPISFDKTGELQAPAATISTYKNGQKIALTELTQ